MSKEQRKLRAGARKPMLPATLISRIKNAALGWWRLHWKTFGVHMCWATGFLIVGLVVKYKIVPPFLHSAEASALDSGLRALSPLRSSSLRIVAINDNDYKQMFLEQSPLEPQRVLQLIEAVASGHPRVIAVDIDTSGTNWSKLVTEERLRRWPPVVWVRNAPDWGTNIGVQPFLGGNRLTNALFGVTGLKRGSDGVVRYYRRRLKTTEGELDSLPWAVVKAYTAKNRDLPLSPMERQDSRAPGGDSAEGKEDLALNFSREAFADSLLSASDVLDAASSEAWLHNGVFSNKIVVLGGTFQYARDAYETPLGLVNGVELNAQAIASDLENRQVHDAKEDAIMWLEIGLAEVLAVLVYVWRDVRPAVWFCTLLTPTLAVFGSVVAFFYFHYWVNFIPILFWVHLEFHFELLKDNRHLRQRLRHATGEALAEGRRLEGRPRAPGEARKPTVGVC